MFGYDTAVISGTIGFVKEKFALDAVMEGWYVSSALVGCLAGVSVAGYLSDRFGRKWTLILSGILFSISGVGCALAPTHTALTAFRLIGGIGIGVASMLSPLYISEIAPPHIRGRMVALYQFAITVGILASYFVNAWLLHISQSAPAGGSGWMHHLFVAEVWRGMLGSETIPAIHIPPVAAVRAGKSALAGRPWARRPRSENSHAHRRARNCRPRNPPDQG